MEKKIKRLLNTDLHADLRMVIRTIDTIVTHDDEDGDSIDPRNIQKAADTLAVTRDLLRQLDSDFKDKTKALKAQLAPYELERNAIKAAASKIEDQLDKCLFDLYEEGDISAIDGVSTALSRLSVVRKKSCSVTDASQVPDEYLLPREKCIDHAKVLEALDKGVDVPGAMLGWNVSFRATLKEQIEV